MNTNAVITIIVIIVLLIGGWYFFTQTDNETENGADTSGSLEEQLQDSLNEVDESDTAADNPQTTNVSYTGNGFSPATVEAGVGDTVTWTNGSNGRMWIASAVHPTHELYDGTSLREHCDNGSSNTFDQCASGNVYSFTFEKAGEWKYHNHASPNHTGRIIVR